MAPASTSGGEQRRARGPWRGAALVLAVGLLGACGGGDDDGAGAAPSPSSTTTNSTTTTTAPQRTHTVQAGDTLTAIAQAQGVTVPALVEANGIADPDRIQVGQVLVIPEPGDAAATTTSSTAPAR